MKIHKKFITICAFLLLIAGKGEAAVGGTTIGGCIYTGEGSVTYAPAGAEIEATWSTVYADAAPIIDGQVMVQNQHSGGAVVIYGTMGLGVDGNCWEATIPDTVTPGIPDVPDLIVMFSAPGHDSTSREFTWNAALGEFTHPNQGGGVVGIDAEATGPQDAYLPPLDAAGNLPTANLLHLVFYDEFTNGAPDGVDLGLNGVEVQVIDEDGTVVATGITGAAPFTTADGVLYDSNALGGIPHEGTVYFTGLPGGKEYKVVSNPKHVTQAANPHLTLKRPHTTPESCQVGKYGYDNTTCNWYQTYTEEGGHAWEAYLWPGDPGTEGGAYLTWHGFIEKIGNDASGNPAIAGTISGILIDADGNDPEEPFAQVLDGRIAPTNARFEDGTAWDLNANSGGWGQPGLPNLTVDVIPNGRVPDTILALYTLGDFPVLVATTEGSGIANYNDPAGAAFTFTNVPPGQYEIFAFDRDLVNVPNVGSGVNVIPGMNSQLAIMLPRFAGRGMGFVENNGAFVSGANVKVFYKSGATKQVETTNANGYFQFDALPETGSAGFAYVDLQDGDTIRGKIITEEFQQVQLPTNLFTSVTHNAMSRVIQWWTLNYFIDLQVEDIPTGVGNVTGVVHYEHLPMDTWVGNGVWDEAEEKIFQGVTVNLLDNTGAIVGTSTTGLFDKADTKLQGWHVPYTFPPNEIGGVFAGPVVCPTCTETAGTPGSAVGFYEFRDVPPGTYRVEAIPPAGLTDMYGMFFTSLNGNGNGITGIPVVAGADVRDEDILFFDGTNFQMFFDGSANGLPGNADIDALHVVDQDTFYVSFVGAGTLQTIAIPAGLASLPFSAEDEDVVLYDAGDWSLYFEGSAYGLGDMNDEDIDALAILPDGRMVISTRGSANANNVANITALPISSTTGWTGTNPRPLDEDLLVFDGTGFDMYLDASDVGVSLNGGNAEDVWGVGVAPNGDIYLSTNRTFTAEPTLPAPSLTGGGNDAFACRGAITGRASSCTSTEFLFQGTAYGLANTGAESLDAFSPFGLGLRDNLIVTGGLNSRLDLAVTTIDVANGANFGVPLAGEIEGGMFSGNGDLDPNPTSLLFDEATAIVGSPVAVYDHFNYLLGVMYQGDPYCNSGNNAVYIPGTYPTNPFACRLLGADPQEKPESERRFAAGIHRYNGNDPNFTKNPFHPMGDKANGFNSNFDSMELPMGMPQGGYKMEAAWTPLTPAGGGVTADICVVDLTGVSFPAEPPLWGAQVTVSIEDDFGVPIVGAEVFGTWSTAGSMNCITNGAGQCSIALEKVEGEPPPAFVDFNVTDVVSGVAWYIYNPAGIGCITGITINNP